MAIKILIVEDDDDILALLKDVLEKDGFEVTGLNYTESILKSITKYQAGLVILDFLLPGINGGELCHEIKCQKSLGTIPVIMLSAFPRVIESLGDYGADIFMAKPFDIDELLKAVHSCLGAELAIA